MASGHVNRVKRPNTWPHRPTLQRVVFPCQLGAVHTWRIATMPTQEADVEFLGSSSHEPRQIRGFDYRENTLLQAVFACNFLTLRG
jgi:hypothetical protein